MSDSSGHVRVVPGRNERGEHVFSVLVKRSYRVVNRQVASRADRDQQFRETDEHYTDADPRWPVVRHESELAACKAASDVVVIGKAYAVNGAATQQMQASVSVGDREKRLLVTGDRRCRHRDNALPIFSEPIPFVEMEIRYDRAYGGRDETSVPGMAFDYPRNYVGRGVALRNVRATLEGLPLPNIEDPGDPLTPERIVIEDPARWHLQPIPQGLGWRHRAWYPRSALLATYPPFLTAGTVTTEERMGLLQANQIALAKQSRLAPFEAGYNNGASLGLIIAGLRGDERVTLRGMTPDGLLDFRLPGEAPQIALDLGEGLKPLPARIHTVSIRPDDLAMDVVWGGALPYPGPRWLANVTRLHAEVH